MDLTEEVVDRAKGYSAVVVVQGLGFVGGAMAAVAASRVDQKGAPRFFVIGVDLDTDLGRERIDRMNQGLPTVESDDPELARLATLGAVQQKNLVATCDTAAYAVADVVVVDIPLDARIEGDRAVADLSAFESAIATVAATVRASCLVLIETTVPPGTTSEVVVPTMRREFAKRGIDSEPLVAHSYERVMPGKRYVESVSRFWRCYAGSTPEAAVRARDFLEAVIDVEDFPLTELASPLASELAKVLENSYRAMNIAFIEEWGRAAEDAGINLFEVIEAIRMRKGTHDNIRQPGFGVGGYCLPKDGYVAQWGLENLVGSETQLRMTMEALKTNYRMPLRTLEIVREAMGGDLRDAVIGLAGISYLPDVGDTRNSPAGVFVDAAIEEGCRVIAHDRRVGQWDEYPEVSLVSMEELRTQADAIVLTLPDEAYTRADSISPHKRGVVVDACGVVPDAVMVELQRQGHVVRTIGRGDIGRGGDA